MLWPALTSTAGQLAHQASGMYRFCLSPQLATEVLQLRDGQAICYAVAREDKPDAAMPVAETIVNMAKDRVNARASAETPNHITAGRWVEEGLRLTRVLRCSSRQLYVFVYSPAKEFLTSLDMTYQQACAQLEQVHDFAQPLIMPQAARGGAKHSIIYKFALPAAVCYDVLGLQPGDPITWTAVKQDQPHARQLMRAQAKVSGSAHYLTAAGSRHVGVVGRWVHEEGVRLQQVRWSTQSWTLVQCLCMPDSDVRR